MTIKTKEIVTVRTVYVCTAGHEHKNYDMAIKCDNRYSNHKVRNLESSRRILKVGELRQKGLTFKEIGRIIGRADNPRIPVGAMAVRELYGKFERGRHLIKAELGARARNVIRNSKLPVDKDVIRKAIENGSLNISKIRNAGPLTEAEIYQWCGVDPKKVPIK